MADYWRGDFYGQADNFIGGARLMVLGEAHYHHSAPIGTDTPEMTKDVVTACIEGRLGANAQFFRCVERLVTKRLHEGLSREQSASFWHSVIFSNYIPVVAGNEPGIDLQTNCGMDRHLMNSLPMSQKPKQKSF